MCIYFAQDNFISFCKEELYKEKKENFSMIFVFINGHVV